MRRIRHTVRTAVIFLLVLMLAVPAHAATDLGLNVNGVTAKTENQESGTWSTNGDGSWTNSDGVLSGVAKGKKGTLSNYVGEATLTFSIPSAGTFSFSYKDITLNSGSLTIDGTSVTAAGTFTKEFTEAGTVTVVIQSAKGNYTTTATIYDISFLTAGSTSVTFKAVVGVDYTVNGVSVTEETGDQEVSITTDTVSVTAVYDDSSQIIREWKAGDGSAYSLEESGFAKPAESITLLPVLGPKGTPQFTVNGARYYNWDEAFTGISNTTVTVTQSGTLPAGDYTVPSGVTLLVPFDTAGTCYTTEPADDNNLAWVEPTPYRTLTMASGTHLTINGAMSLSAMHHTGQALENCGLTTGKYGHVDMAENSTITVNDGGTLYAWGYVTGSGSVTVKSGAKCYEYFVVQDFKDGNSLSDLANNKDKRVFMMNNYYVQNIVVPVTIEAGGYLNGYSSFFFQTLKISKHAPVPFITPEGEDGLFKLSSGEIVKRYDYASDRLFLDVAGDIEMGNISITGSTGLVDITIDSVNYDMSIGSNITLTLKSGAELNLSAQSLVMIPGTELYIEEGASLNIKDGQRFVLHDIDQWQKNYCYNARVWPLAFVPNRTYTFQDSDLKDPVLVVNGTVDASAGYLYVTAGGGNTYSTDSGVVKFPAYSESTNSQYMRSGQTFDDYAITTAWLKNADGSFVKHTADAAADYIYNSEHGKWATEHTVTSTVTAPTCTADGYTTHTCACGYSYTDTPVDALGHDWATTWTQGETSHWYDCSRCDAVKDEAEHSYDDGVVTTAPTCYLTGEKTYTCDTCGYTKTETVAQLSHSDADNDGDHKCDNGCTESGVTTCGDSNTDHICDTDSACTVYSTGKNACSDGDDTDHKCDYGCGKDNLTAHSYGTPAFTWDGYECTAKVTCACGDEQNVAVTVTSATTTTATCKVEGIKTYTATATYNEQTYTETKTENIGVDADAHAWSVSYEWADDGKSCTATRTCGNDASHNVTETVTATSAEKTAATCTAMGTTTYTATFAETWAATQTKDVVDIATVDHTPGEAVCENVNAATCYAEGSYEEVVYCSVAECEAEISRTAKTIEKIAHTPAEAVREKEVAATCYAEGSYEEVVYCSVAECEAEISRTAKTTEKIAHTPGDAVREKEVAATCYAEGSYEEVVYCSVEGCGAEISRTTKTIEQLTHEWGDVSYTWSDDHTTCTATRTCGTSGCTDSATATVTYETTAPTCAEAGYTTYTATFEEEWAEAQTKKVDGEAATGEHNYVDGKCSECGAVKTEEEVDQSKYTWGQNIAVGLIEPWFMRANAKATVVATGEIADYSSLKDYGIYFVRANDLEDPDVAQADLAIEDILNNEKTVLISKENGAFHTGSDANSGYFSARFNEGIYTYELDESIYVLAYITEADGSTYYAPVRERNLLETVQKNKDDTTGRYKETEKAVYAAMVELYESTVARRAGQEVTVYDFNATLMKDHDEIICAESNSYTFSHNQQVLLIEPWGIRFNCQVKESGSVIDYNNVLDYGAVIFYDTEDTISDGLALTDLLTKENAYVMNKNNGGAFVASVSGKTGNYIGVRYNHEIYTYQMQSNAYVAFFVKDDEGYHFGDVKVRNVLDVMTAGAANGDDSEKAVVEDMNTLNTAILAHRKAVLGE